MAAVPVVPGSDRFVEVIHIGQHLFVPGGKRTLGLAQKAHAAECGVRVFPDTFVEKMPADAHSQENERDDRECSEPINI